MPQTTHPAAADMPQPDPTPAHATDVSVKAASGAIPAESLFKGAQAVCILHKGDLYHLRITRNDKLILTK